MPAPKEQIMMNGYINIKSPNHPYRNSLNYVRLHRLIIEKKIGRFLTKEEVVHHINRDTLDNRLENLELLTIPKHSSISNIKYIIIEKDIIELFKGTKELLPFECCTIIMNFLDCCFSEADYKFKKFKYMFNIKQDVFDLRVKFYNLKEEYYGRN